MWQKGVYQKRVKDYPIALSGCFASVVEGRFIVGGGQGDDYKTHKKVFEYDQDADTWKSLPNMNTPRCMASSCYIGKTLFVTGGWDDNFS